MTQQQGQGRWCLMPCCTARVCPASAGLRLVPPTSSDDDVVVYCTGFTQWLPQLAGTGSAALAPSQLTATATCTGRVTLLSFWYICATGGGKVVNGCSMLHMQHAGCVLLAGWYWAALKAVYVTCQHGRHQGQQPDLGDLVQRAPSKLASFEQSDLVMQGAARLERR